jgi:3-mercaptopyruvate sulfurtransferase SseA
LAVSVVGALAFNVLREKPLSICAKYQTKAERIAEQAKTVGFENFQNALALTRAKNAGATGVVDKAELEKIVARTAQGESASGASNTSVLIIDARSDLFFAQGHIPGAENISVEFFERDLANVRGKIAAAKRLVVYCDAADCPLSEVVVVRLRKAGIKTQIGIYQGGWQEWRGAFPVRRRAMRT